MKLQTLGEDENTAMYLVVQDGCDENAGQSEILANGILWKLECSLRPDEKDQSAYSLWLAESNAAEENLKAEIANAIRPLLNSLSSKYTIELGYENWNEDETQQKHRAECFAIIKVEKS